MTEATSKPRIAGDVTFTVEAGGLLASNHRARRHVWINAGLANLVMTGAANGPLAAADRTRFSNLDGLLADPTCLDREGAAEPTSFEDAAAALAFLAERMILVEDEAAYAAFFAEKTSILDRKHFGTFHQQVGTELRLKKRVDPARWWYEQKFDPATGDLRANLYRAVQGAFLERFFADLDLEGKTVLDFGCGSGLASRRFVEAGARVIGADPDSVLLEEAKARCGDAFEPCLMDLAAEDPLAALPKTQVDLVWMADVFMFYFHPLEGGRPPIAPDALLAAATAGLAPDGRCVIMQPHASFWLAPWLGDAAQPFTAVTEYADRLYSVTPSLEAVSRSVEAAGLAIKRVHEPLADEAAEPTPECDARALAFARRFPLWWVFDCCRQPDALREKAA